MICFPTMTTTKHAAKALLMFLVLTCTSSRIQATTVANGIEMGLAAAAVLPDMLGHHYDTTDYKKTAAFLHLTTDGVSILNKLFFFGNNINGQGLDGFRNNERDCTVNAAWLARDITRCIQHLREYRKAEDVIPVAPEEVVIQPEPVIEDDIFLSYDAMPSAPLKPEEISSLAYLSQVLVIPSLRGLTAVALAYSQDDASGDFKSAQGRLLATSAHSFVRLAQEYTELGTGSSYKKTLLAAALIANAVYLLKDIDSYKQYSEFRKRHRADEERRRVRQAEQEAERERLIQHRLNNLIAQPQNINERVGNCASCFDDNVNVINLPCGHAEQCRDCFLEHIGAKLHVGDPVICPHVGCGHQLAPEHVRGIVGDDHALLRRFVAAGLPRMDVEPADRCPDCFLYHQPAIVCAEARRVALPEDREFADEMVRRGVKICPGQNCGNAVEKNGGCSYIRCAACRHEFCWNCLQPCPGHRMEIRNGVHVNPCGCPVF